MEVELARQQWADGHRRVEWVRGDRVRYAQLLADVELVTRELRSRVGQVFTLAELADVYDGADRWVRDAIEDADPDGGAAPEVGTTADAAFHVYARGASDYTP